MEIEIKNDPESVVYYGSLAVNQPSAHVGVFVGIVKSVTCIITEQTDSKTYLVSIPKCNNSVNFAEGNVTQDLKVAMGWLSDYLQAEYKAIAPAKLPAKVKKAVDKHESEPAF